MSTYVARADKGGAEKTGWQRFSIRRLLLPIESGQAQSLGKHEAPACFPDPGPD